MTVAMRTIVTSDLETITWPLSSVDRALEGLAQRTRLLRRSLEALALPARVYEDSVAQTQWIEATARRLGLEVEPVTATYAEVEELIRRAGPALVRLAGDRDARIVAILAGGRRAVSVLAPNLSVQRVSPGVIVKAICREVETPLVADTTRFLEEAGVPAGRRERAHASLLRQRLSSIRIEGCWLLQQSPIASFWSQMRRARLPRRLLLLACAHAVQYVLWILSWWVVGRAALEGRLDRGWLLAWALLLITLVPFQLLTTWWQGVLAIGIGALLKSRLLHGALKLEPEEIRHQGAGQLLGRVIESEAVESLALGGGFFGLVAGIELVIAGIVLGAASPILVLLLLAWTALALLLGWRGYVHRRRWTATRVAMTHDLVEQMVGHRTRLAQEAPERWHSGEDEMIARHLELSLQMDREAALLMALVPRGWLAVGILGLAPAFVSGRSSPVTIAIALGGILLGYRALRRLASGLWQIAGAAISWEQAAPIFHAAAREGPLGSPAFALAPRWDAAAGVSPPVIEAHDLDFRYRAGGEPALKGCSVRISPGERVLLEGPSGSGKSTLASLLTGLRVQQSGLLLLDGLDRQTLGLDLWRRHAVLVPQFHENHVFTGPFAFNLFMGGRWPAHPEDFERAEGVCRELGLGELLGRMPSGMLQAVGESGWQLSHGERSRLYIARALLQSAGLIVLDESLGQLDPENLERSLQCVLARARTLVVVAHP